MTMFDEAEAIRAMMSMCKSTQSMLAERLGVSQSYIANKLRLLSLNSKIRELVIFFDLSERHARTLLRIKSDEKQAELIKKISEMKLTVRETEALVDSELISEMPDNLLGIGERESIIEMEKIIEESVKRLKSNGIKAKWSMDRVGEMSYITVFIG